VARLVALLVSTAVVATVAAFAGGAAAGPSATLANSVTFPDSTGDTAGGDIQSITVSNTDAGLITFRIEVPNRPTFTGDMVVILYIDSDANPATGDPDLLGAEYLIVLAPNGSGGAEVDMARWSGTEFVTTPRLSLVSSYANGATISVNANELGATSKLNFGVQVITGIVYDAQGAPDLTNAQRDLAPDAAAGGFYSYEVKLAPLVLNVKSSGQVPKTPKAGGSFTVYLVAARSDTGATIKGGTVTCKATIAFKAIVAKVHRVIGDKATCTFAVPMTARGKTIRVALVLQFEDLNAKKNFSAKIS
jgi:hypothetical protein